MAEVIIDVVGRDSFSSTLGNFGSIITGIQSAIELAANAFRTFGDVAMQGLDAIASYERMSASLETLVAKELLATGAAQTMAEALGQSGDMAEELLQWNQQLAINSPFSAEGVNNAFRMAMAYGFTTTEAQRLTEAMIDFAAGSGASEAAMEAIARALGQISATGKVTGGDMLQLVNAGLPVVEILAEGFGVTTAELMKMREQGLLPATEAIEYITVYLEENFAGAAERQANTWAGLQGTFADIKAMGLREFFGGLFDVLQPVAVELSAFLQTEGMERLSTWGSYLGIFTQAVVDLVTGNKLYDLGAAIQGLAAIGEDGTRNPTDFFYALGTAIRVFQQGLDDEEGAVNAFMEGMEKFTQLTGLEISPGALIEWADNAIGNIADGLATAIDKWMQGNGPEGLSNDIIGFLDGVGRGEDADRKFDDAALRLFTSLSEAISLIRWEAIASAMDGAVARSIEGNDWVETGNAFREGLGTLFSGTGEAGGFNLGAWVLQLVTAPGVAISTALAGSQLGQAIIDAISDFFSGFIPGDLFGNLAGAISPDLIVPDGTQFIEDMRELGGDLWNGLVEGFTRISWDIDAWFHNNFVQPVKDFFGIASPSTLMAQIGRDIILGLVQGVVSMLGGLLAIGLTLAQSFVTTVSTKFGELVGGVIGIFNQIKEAWEDSGLSGVFELLTGGISLNWPTGTTGTTGSGPGDTSHDPRGGLPGDSGMVTNNYTFYGPVYMSNVGPEGTYECPSPNPILSATAPSLPSGGLA
jgi:tape measure domain-containing protein